MTPDAAMFFAAGLGTRMAPLTRDRPKPLIDVAGRPLIDHALDLAKAAGITRKVINLHYLGDMIRTHLAGQDVVFSDESDRLLDTGGGLCKALPLLPPGPVFTMNTDAVWRGGNPFTTLAAAWDDARMEALLLLIDPARALGHRGVGDFAIGADHRLTRAPAAIYAGAQIINTDRLTAEPEAVFSLNRVWDDMIARGTLYGVVYPGNWCDVGRPESIALAEAMMKGAA